MTDYNLILSEATRDDGYVNATALCKAHEARLDNWKRRDETQDYIKALTNHLNENPSKSRILESSLRKDSSDSVELMYIKRGKGGGTFIHPLLAIHLAEWLSPEFSVFVKSTFKSFLDADVNMTKNLISRTESLEAINQIAEKTEVQRQYLRSEFALNYEGKLVHESTGDHWVLGRVKGYNNDVLGVKDGERSMMHDNDKATLLFMQLAQAKKLERNRKSDNPYLNGNDAKMDAYEITKSTYELMYGEDATKPRDYPKMNQSDKLRLK